MGYLAQADDLNEATLRRAVIMGTVMASFCVESFGAERLKTLTGPDIEKRASQLLALISVKSDGRWLKHLL